MPTTTKPYRVEMRFNAAHYETHYWWITDTGDPEGESVELGHRIERFLETHYDDAAVTIQPAGTGRAAVRRDDTGDHECDDILGWVETPDTITFEWAVAELPAVQEETA